MSSAGTPVCARETETERGRGREADRERDTALLGYLHAAQPQPCSSFHLVHVSKSVPVCVCISNIIKHIAISLAVFYEALQPASRTMKNENQFSGSTLELERIKMATVTVTVTQNNSRTGEVYGEEGGRSTRKTGYILCAVMRQQQWETASDRDRERAM